MYILFTTCFKNLNIMFSIYRETLFGAFHTVFCAKIKKKLLIMFVTTGSLIIRIRRASHKKITTFSGLPTERTI